MTSIASRGATRLRSSAEAVEPPGQASFAQIIVMAPFRVPLPRAVCSESARQNV
jgi:hypothetical protein